MDLTYSADYEAFRNEVREFLQNSGAQAPTGRIDGRPGAADIALPKKLIEHGYAARSIPKKYGGYGAETDDLKSHINFSGLRNWYAKQQRKRRVGSR